MKVAHTFGEKWPEKVVQRSFIKGHSFPNSLYYYETSGRLVFVRFWRKLKTPKIHFEII